MRTGLGRYTPKDTLQTWPVDVAIYGSTRREHGRARQVAERSLGKFDIDEPPVGDLLGVLMSIGRWTPPDESHFGPFTVAPAADREYLINLAPAEDWRAAQTLELRVFRPPAEAGREPTVKDRFLPSAPPETQYRGMAPRKTRWHALTTPLPVGTFADDTRGVRLRMSPDGKLPYMDWFHRTKAYVFHELAPASASEAEELGFMQVVLLRTDEPVKRPGWFRADETVFEA